MPRYWMISNREVSGSGLGSDHAPLSYWVSDAAVLNQLKGWKKTTKERFHSLLLKAADGFPVLPPEQHERQKHVTLFVHGYNNSWDEAAARYQSICSRLVEPNKLGVCVLFTWPSDGMATNYLPDRADARRSGADLADVLSDLYDWLLGKQAAGAADDAKACKAKTSLIAHSMGNYVLQNALQAVWTRKNRPLLLSLINQLVMVAADVDNDLFSSGEDSDGSDGDAIANLSYRITALYTGLDSVLGLSAGMKHFGKRRLGRSGLDSRVRKPDNVWDIDCTRWLKSKSGTHSAYFETPEVLDLMHKLLIGRDRSVLQSTLLA